MYYTGMLAFDLPIPVFYHDISALSSFAILVVTFVILGFALLRSPVDRRMSGQQVLLDDERKMLRALIDPSPLPNPVLPLVCNRMRRIHNQIQHHLVELTRQTRDRRQRCIELRLQIRHILPLIAGHRNRALDRVIQIQRNSSPSSPDARTPFIALTSVDTRVTPSSVWSIAVGTSCNK